MVFLLGFYCGGAFVYFAQHVWNDDEPLSGLIDWVSVAICTLFWPLCTFLECQKLV